jgi:ATP-dependent RNA helicase RhlE
MTTFSQLNLNPKILSALEAKGYLTPTPIQAQAIPHLLEGKDLLGIAQTGTGKTAAFSLPILHNLAKGNVSVKSGHVRTLILTPTRELASQIAENIELYGKDLGLRYAIMFGGVSERPQIAAMQRGVDILIATPGRLLDLMQQGYIRFMQLEVFVLDEADRMLNMGFINDIKKIIAKIPQKRQSLFFSATMPKVIADLAHSILQNPIQVEITPESTTVERIDQKINFVARSNKPQLLKRIIKQDETNSILVFSKTKHGANRVVDFLEQHSIPVAAIHGNKSQSAREKALSDFRSGQVKVLIATDIAARGIDIPAISHVINYDLPLDPESYVHRIGRTARAGRSGVAISFCDHEEKQLLRDIEKQINFKIPVDETHPFHGVEGRSDSSGLGAKRSNFSNQRRSGLNEGSRHENSRNRNSGNAGNSRDARDGKSRNDNSRSRDFRDDSGSSRFNSDSPRSSSGSRFSRSDSRSGSSNFRSDSGSRPARSNSGKSANGNSSRGNSSQRNGNSRSTSRTPAKTSGGFKNVFKSIFGGRKNSNR